jgi:DKNYY family
MPPSSEQQTSVPPPAVRPISAGPSAVIKVVRIFLLVLIIIGVGLIATYKFWVPNLVALMIGNSIPPTSYHSKPVSRTPVSTQNIPPNWIHVVVSTSTTFLDSNFNPLTADAATYEIFATSSDSTDYCFARDKNNVYYNLEDNSAEDIDADVSTFVSLDVLGPQSGDYGYCYGKDETHVYSYFGGAGPDGGGGILQNADPNTFTTNASIYPFAKDAAHVFFADVVVTGADPNTFATIPNSGLAKDKYHVYQYGFQVEDAYSVVSGADPTTFSYNVQTDISKDKTHVWAGGALDGLNLTPIQNVDPATFRALNIDYSKDAYHIYYGDIDSGSLTPITADLASFNLYYPIYRYDDPELAAGYRSVVDYAYDKNFVYYDGQVIPGADVATFTPVPGLCANDSSCTYDAQDKNHKYLQGRVVQ